jgi:hypothetical protein
MARRPPARRRVLAVLAVLAVALASAALGARYWPGTVRTGSAAAHGARIVRSDIASRFVHQTLPQTAAVPSGGSRGRPLLV